MDRRKFLTAGPVGAGLALTTLSGAAAGEEKRPLKNEPQSAPDDFALNEMTIAAMQKKMESGELTSLAITGMYLKRIDAIDKNGIRINAVIELNPDARAIAKTLDAERKENKVRGPLHGIPVLIKNNIDILQGRTRRSGHLPV